MVYVMCPRRFPVVVEWLASVTFWNRATLYTKSVQQASQVGFFGVALDYFYRRQIKKNNSIYELESFFPLLCLFFKIVTSAYSPATRQMCAH